MYSAMTKEQRLASLPSPWKNSGLISKPCHIQTHRNGSPTNFNILHMLRWPLRKLLQASFSFTQRCAVLLSFHRQHFSSFIRVLLEENTRKLKHTCCVHKFWQYWIFMLMNEATSCFFLSGNMLGDFTREYIGGKGLHAHSARLRTSPIEKIGREIARIAPAQMKAGTMIVFDWEIFIKYLNGIQITFSSEVMEGMPRALLQRSYKPTSRNVCFRGSWVRDFFNR